MALDEIVQVCPCPVDKWCADSGGKGIQIITVAHGEAQLASRWGDQGKQVILDTAGVKVILSGVTDVRTLDAFSKLCGDTALREHGEDRHSRHPVMSPEMIRQLPAGRGLVIRGGLSPVIARVPRAWRNRAYRKARRRGYEVASLTAAPAPASLAQPSRPELARGPAVTARLHPARDGALVPGDREIADVLPADDIARPWRSR